MSEKAVVANAPEAKRREEQGPPVLREDANGVVRLTLNRPDSRNALSDAMIAALSLALDDIAGEPRVRAVVLAGAGPAFCAGHHLKELTGRRADPDKGAAYFLDLMRRCSAMMQKIVRLPQPVIAAVEGVASAAGCQLVASCDLAVAGERARFATPGVDIGLFCSTPMVALSRNVASKHAMEMLLLGEFVDAREALRIGLVNRVVAEGSAIAEASALGRRIAAKPAATLRIGKRAFYEQREMTLDEAYDYAAKVMADNLMIADAEEGVGAFIEKREPRWEGG
ncbi:MAG: enoyl-CoA hydratase [Salinarimonadaceae bacterium]|nr:MAG: enoyl-CoA hydratase [Salinarimonadaceae bacterium]